MKTNIELNEKQSMILWMVFAWFQGKFPNTGIMSKLYKGTSEKFRKKHWGKYDKIILRRIVKLAKWVETKHPEFIQD